LVAPAAAEPEAPEAAEPEAPAFDDSVALGAALLPLAPALAGLSLEVWAASGKAKAAATAAAIRVCSFIRVSS
jgi:hypothetical protein